MTTTISIDDLDQVTSLQDLETWTAGCTACAARQDTNQVVYADGDKTSPIMLIGMAPAHMEAGSGVPFCGRAELARSRCVSCVNYETCYSWQTGLGATHKLTDHCLGYNQNPPGTEDRVPSSSIKIGPFTVGGVISAGQILDDALVALGVDRQKLFLTNIVLCGSKAGNPKPSYVLSCSRIRLATQRLLKPRVIVPLGLMAIAEYSPRKLVLSKDHGIPFNYESQGHKSVVVPTYHPSAILRKMLAYGQAGLAEKQQCIQDVSAWKWNLYQDLGLAINHLSTAQIQNLILPGITLEQGKLPIKTRP